MQFKDVVGHQALKNQLIYNVHNNRISHAQLFLGPEGSGGLPMALAFAQYIQCRDKKPEDACGVCPSCLKHKKFEHPDLHFFFPVARTKAFENTDHEKITSKDFYRPWRELLLTTPYFKYNHFLEKIGIENKQPLINANSCNEIIKTLGLKSFESEYKIVLIWLIEGLYHSAAPKLLKILEEPPEKTVFLLVSHNQEKILSTIRSRTQLVKVPRLNEEEVRQALTEQYGCEPGRAKQISLLCEGDFAEALRLALAGNEPLADFDTFRYWMRLCYRKNVPELLKWVDSISKAGREKQKSFLQYGLKMFRFCLLSNYKASPLVHMEGEEKDFIHAFSPFVNHLNGLQIVEAFNDVLYHIERNANPKILFTDLSFNLARLFAPFKK